LAIKNPKAIAQNFAEAERIAVALTKAIEQIRSPEVRQQIGDFLASKIKLRTRLGKGVDDPGTANHPLKPLKGFTKAGASKLNAQVERGLNSYLKNQSSKSGAKGIANAENAAAKLNAGGSTIAERERLQRKGKLSELTTPGKSNLTRSGQLLDSIKAHPIEGNKVKIAPEGDRKDPGRKQQLNNQQVAKYVTDQGRAFINPSDAELKAVQDQVKAQVKNLVRANLTKK
jgi:hypothetical protein